MILSPLLSFFICLYLHIVKRNQQAASKVSLLFMFMAFTASLFLFYAQQANEAFSITATYSTWVPLEDIPLKWGLQLDTAAAVMAVLVTFISFVVQLYSIGYMHSEKSPARYYSYLNLFTFFMLVLITAPTFPQMFIGWEGVGLCSYLLIGYYYKRTASVEASYKAFITNRIADIGLMLGMLFFFCMTGSFDITPDAMAQATPGPMVNLICFLFLVGAMGKSAQLGFHVWLPDAMEGPTPVSALIHAATMVAAGIFLLIKTSFLFELAPIVKQAMFFVGLFTALISFCISIVETDIKRIIAYSTISHLGLMFMACGAGVYYAAFFHLFTHAFFKALLFLGSGSVIHAFSHEQDVKKMGGVWDRLPYTYTFMWIGTIGVCGLPLFAGYYSKEAMLAGFYHFNAIHGNVWVMVLILAALTSAAVYMGRLMYLTFHGQPQADDRIMAHLREAPASMQIANSLLALCVAFAGIFGQYYFLDPSFFKGSIYFFDVDETLQPSYLHWLPIAITILLIILSAMFYLKKAYKKKWFTTFASPLITVAEKRFYFDSFYEKWVSASLRNIGSFFYRFIDKGVIDYYGPQTLTRLTYRIADWLKRFQDGRVHHYAMVMVSGLVAIYLILKFKG